MARLTIPDEATYADFTVVTSTTEFPISFSLFAKADLTVYVDDVALDQSAFSFTGTLLDGGGYDGGTVTLNTAVTSGTVRVERNVAAARTSNFAPASSTPVQTVDAALNRVTAGLQDLERKKVSLPIGARASKFHAYDADGNSIASAGSVDGLAVSTFVETLLGAVSNSAFLTALGNIAGTFINFIQAGTGAVTRTMQGKTRDALSVLDFMPVATADILIAGSSTPDVTTYVQAAVTAAIAQKRALRLPGVLSEYKLTSSISVTGALTIFGDGKVASRFLCVDCDGFVSATGVNHVTFCDIGISLAVRYTTTANTRTAFSIPGTSGAGSCNYWHWERVFIDGFQYGVKATYLSQSSFDVQVGYVFTGIWVYGQSVNNVVIGSSQIAGVDSIATTPAATSTGVRVGDDTQPQPEGFTVQPGTLIFGFKRGVRNQGAINVTVNGAIIDGISEFVILEQSSDTAPAINSNYVDNYGGITGACDTAFYITSSATAYRNDNRGTTLRNNELAIYASSSLNTGYLIEGSYVENVSLVDNKKILGREGDGTAIYSSVRDAKITGGRGHRISGNAWNDSTGFETAVAVQYEGNTGRLAVGADLCSRGGTILGSATWDPGSLADGAGETSAEITVTGAVVGSHFVQVLPPYDLQGITCTAWVSDANTVKIRLQNETGGTIDLASGTWRVAAMLVV